MGIMDNIIEQARKRPMRVAFPEADQDKILQAARVCIDKGICKSVLVGTPSDIAAAAEAAEVSLEGIEIIDATDEALREAVIKRYCAIQETNSAKTMRRKAGRDPMFLALMMQALGDVNICFAGFTHSTGDVIMAGQMVVGLAEGVTTVSSMGIFDIPDYEGSEGRYLGFVSRSKIFNEYRRLMLDYSDE